MTEDSHDTNIAVYSTLVDILRAMRRALAAYLSELGPDWETVFFPDEVLQRLETRRAQRGTLSWSFDEKRPLIDFATFADLAQLAGARPEVAAPFAAMAPNAQVLQVRLLELAAVSEKVTLAHNTDEQDLVTVRSFASVCSRCSVSRRRRRTARPHPAAPPCRPVGRRRPKVHRRRLDKELLRIPLPVVWSLLRYGQPRRRLLPSRTFGSRHPRSGNPRHLL